MYSIVPYRPYLIFVYEYWAYFPLFNLQLHTPFTFTSIIIHSDASFHTDIHITVTICTLFHIRATAIFYFLISFSERYTFCTYITTAKYTSYKLYSRAFIPAIHPSIQLCAVPSCNIHIHIYTDHLVGVTHLAIFPNLASYTTHHIASTHRKCPSKSFRIFRMAF